MARKREEEGKGKSTTATERQAKIDAVQTERRELRRAKKVKRAMEKQNRVEVAELAAPATPMVVNNPLMDLYTKAKKCFIGFGNTHKTMKYIRNSYEMERVCVQFGIPVAEQKIEDAWTEVKDLVSEQVKQFMTNVLVGKATGCFKGYGNTHTTAKYIRNSWEFADLVKNFGEKEAEDAVHTAFLSVFPAEQKRAA